MEEQFVKVKSILPIEIVAAFFAVKEIMDHVRVDASGLPAAQGENMFAMALIMFILACFNLVIMIRAGVKEKFLLIFSTIGFLVWSIGIDITRWEDQINNMLSLSPNGVNANEILPILIILYSLLALIFSINTPAAKPLVQSNVESEDKVSGE